MGNKQSKDFYDSLPKDTARYQSVGKAMNFACLSQEKIVEYIAKLALDKDIKLHPFDKSHCLNSPPEENEEELKTKKANLQQQKLQSTLAAGHEQLPEVKAIFRATQADDFPAQKLEAVRSYSQAMVQRFAAALVLYLSSAVSPKEAGSFFARIEKFLAGEAGNEFGDAMALHLSVLLLENKKLLEDPQVVDNLSALFGGMDPLALYGWSKEALQICRSLEMVRQGLISLLDSAPVPSQAPVLALCHLGLAQGSVDDLLIAIKYMIRDKKAGESIDITGVLKKLVEGLPDVGRFFPTPTFDIAKESIKSEVPFEKIYLPKLPGSGESSADEAFCLSSAASDEFVYLYSSRLGMLVLGAGKGKIMGKVYAKGGMLEKKDPVQLIVIKNKLYCYAGKRFSRLNPYSMKKKDSKKFAEAPVGDLVASTGNSTLVIYAAKAKESEVPEKDADSAEEKVKGTVSYYDVVGKQPARKVEITHTVQGLKNIAAVGSTLILLGEHEYETVDLQPGAISATTKKGESALLKKASLCIEPVAHKTFLAYHKSDSEGLCLADMVPLQEKPEQGATFDAKFAEARHLLGLEDSDKSGLNNKRQLIELLGFHQVNAEQSEKTTRVNASRAGMMLSLLASRAVQAQAMVQALTDSQQVVKLQNIPLAVHLTPRSLGIQIELAGKLYQEAVKSPETLDDLYSVLTILNAHLVAMGRCDFSLGECLGKAGLAKFDQFCAEVLQTIVRDKTLTAGTKTPEHRKLAECIEEVCNSCLSNSKLHIEGASTPVKELSHALAAVVSSKKPTPQLYSLAAWLAIPEKMDLVAEKFLGGDQDAFTLFDSYFKLEYECLKAKLEARPDYESSLGKALSAIKGPMCGLIERIFLSFAYSIPVTLFCSRALTEKKYERQEAIAATLAKIIQSNLTLMVGEIRLAYGKAKEKLVGAADLVTGYIAFWRLVEAELEEDLLIAHALTLLTTTVMGMAVVPEQLFRFTEILMKTAEELKAVLLDIAAEKERNVETGKSLFPIHDVDKRFESPHPLPPESLIFEQDFEFPGATKVKVWTAEGIDIPDASNCRITISSVESQKELVKQTLTAKNAKSSGTIEGSRVKISAKVESTYTSKTVSYKGYCLLIKPKYIYGQRILKSLLRSILWTACYMSKATLQSFEDSGRQDRNKELVNNILGSRLLSGGLPTLSFPSVFSPQFNKRFAAIKEELNIDESYESPADTETIYKEIMLGNNEKASAILQQIRVEHAKKQPFARFTDLQAEEIVRATFALLLKMTDSLASWKLVYEASEKQEAAFGKLVALWGAASRMKIWFVEQKKVASDKYKEEEWDRIIKGIAKTVQDKVSLLLLFRSPEIAEKESRKTQKTVTLVRTESIDAPRRRMSEAELVKSRLEKWKNLLIAKTDEESKEVSLTSSTLKILQTASIPCASLVSYLESYYLRGLAIYGALTIFQRASSYVRSKKIRADVIAWVSSVFKSDSAANWHYSQKTISCGTPFQYMLRYVFFNLISQILEYIIQTKNPSEFECLMDALKWNYTASDHVFIKDCRLFPCLRSEHRKCFVASLWGQPLDSNSEPEALLDAFEYIAIKIVTRALAQPTPADRKGSGSSEEPTMEAMPRLEKSVSSLDESSAARLMDAIMRIIFDEVKRAAESYEKGVGVEPKIVEEYEALQKMDAKKVNDDKSKDWNKLRKDFADAAKGVYSQQFCVRLLQLLYRIFVAIQEDATMKSRVNLIIEDSYMLSLLRLLFIGSTQQQYLVLQILPLLVQVSPENIESACRTMLEDPKLHERFTSSCTLDLMLLYAMKNSERIWSNSQQRAQGNYALYKGAVSFLRGLIRKNKDLGAVMAGLAKTYVFGTKDEMAKLPKNCRGRVFIELIISVFGGDFLGLTKGAKGLAKERNKYSVVAFVGEKVEDKDKKIKVYEWDFKPRVHKEIMLHLVDEEGGSGESSITTLPISEFTLTEDEMPLSDLLLTQGVSKENLMARIVPIICEDPTTGSNAIVRTLGVKAMRMARGIIGQNKEICQALFKKEIVEKLLAQALKVPAIGSHNSALSTEMAIEEMRKNASMMEVSPLVCTGNSPISVRLATDTLVFSFIGSKICIPILAHTAAASKLLTKKDGQDLECVILKKDQEEDTKGKMVVVENWGSADLGKENAASAILLGESLDKVLESNRKIAVPLIEIDSADMAYLTSMLKDIREIAKGVQEAKTNTLVAEYLGKKPVGGEDVSSSNVRSIVRDLLSGKSSEKQPAKTETKKPEIAKTEKEKKVTEEDPLSVFASQNRCKGIFTHKDDPQITDEREKLAKAFAGEFPKIFGNSATISLSGYKLALEDLRIHYARHILQQILLESSMEELKGIVDLVPQILSFLHLVAIEADYTQFGFGAKQWSGKLNAVINSLAGLPDLLGKFVSWLHEKLITRDESSKDSNASRLFSFPQLVLSAPVYPRFVYRFLKQLLIHSKISIVGNLRSGDLLTGLLQLVAISKNAPDKYRSMKLIKSILGTAIGTRTELSPGAITSMLTSKCIKTLAGVCSHEPKHESIIWKNVMEIMQKANSLCKSASEMYGELVQTYCFKDDSMLQVPMAIIKAFPDWRRLITFMWIRMNKEILRGKYECTIESPKPFYNTQYTFLVNRPTAQYVVLNAKLPPGRNSYPLYYRVETALISLDRRGKAKLRVLTEGEKDVKIRFSRFYVHYPYAGSQVFAFGSNDGGRLGLKDTKTTAGPVTIPGLGLQKILSIYSGGSHTIICDKSESLFTSGRGDGRLGSDSTEFKAYTTHPASNVLATSQGATVYYSPDDKCYFATGRNPDHMFVSSSASLSESRFTVKGKDPKQISISSVHALMLFGGNKLYGNPTGKKELFDPMTEGSGSEFALITLPEEIGEVKAVLALNCGSILLCTSKKTGRGELWSFGLKTEPGMGQGEHGKDLDKYKRLDYNAEEIEFKELVGCENAAAAITTKGELYTWGKGAKGMLGLYKPDGTALEEANKPTKVAVFPENSAVEKVSLGPSHMLVITSTKEGRKVWGFGDNSKGQLGDKDTSVNRAEVAFFAGKYPILVCAGAQCSFVACGSGKKEHTPKCVIHSEKNCAEDVMFCRRMKEKTEFWCQDCADNKSLPQVVVATRWPVSKAQERPWPDLSGVELTQVEPKEVQKCGTCGLPIKSAAIYKSVTSQETLCEGCFLKTPTKMDPEMYYRFAGENLVAKGLPAVDIAQFYETSAAGVSFTLKPIYKLELPEEVSDKAIKLSLEEYMAESKSFEREHDMDLLGLINENVLSKDKDITSVSLKGELTVPFARKSTLSKFKSDQLKRRLYMLIKLNKLLFKAINYIDFTSHTQSEEDLYLYYIKVKDYVASGTKDKIAIKAMENLPENSDRPQITLARHKAFVLRSSGQVDHAGKQSLFGQLMQALKTRISLFQKKPREDSYPYRVEFKGEGGSDGGGLFRESIDQICEELQSLCLPLFIPSPNNKTAFGEDREKWTINPSSKQATHIEMYEFLGCMIGMSFRMGHLLAINLSSLFWKQLLGDPVDRADLKAIDSYCVQCLDDIVNIDKKGVDAASFESYIDTCFVTRLSDGSEVELKKNGREIRVTFANRMEYVQLVEKVRLEEGAVQMKAIRTGMAKIVPISIIKLYSWRDVEVKVCGKPTFKVEALKKITQYSGCKETDLHIQYFWQALEEFTDEERSLYLRFVWGRSRMPIGTERFHHTIARKSATRPNDTLPETHTCGFQIDLPEYSSVEIAKERLRYAIRFCKSIDGDRDDFETWED